MEKKGKENQKTDYLRKKCIKKTGIYSGFFVLDSTPLLLLNTD